MEWGIPIKENPLKAIAIKFTDQRRERRVREEELNLLIGAAQKSKNQFIAPIIKFAVETGMRRRDPEP